MFEELDWRAARTRPEKLERISYLLMIISIALIWVGIALGSFVKYFVFSATIGSGLLVLAIVIYIASQLLVKKTAAVQPEAEQKQIG